MALAHPLKCWPSIWFHPRQFFYPVPRPIVYLAPHLKSFPVFLDEYLRGTSNSPCLKLNSWTSLEVQWLKLSASTAGAVSSIPGWGTKILHIKRCGQDIKNNNNTKICTHDPHTAPPRNLILLLWWSVYQGVSRPVFYLIVQSRKPCLSEFPDHPYLRYIFPLQYIKNLHVHFYGCLKIPWMVEPGGLQFMGSQRVGHD